MTSTALVLYRPPPAAVQVPPPPPAKRRNYAAERRKIALKIFARVTDGARIHSACTAEGIQWRKLWTWMEIDPDLRARYARARKASGASWEDRATEEVENATPKTVGVAALREDNYRWRAKMASPREYGDKIDVTTDGQALPAAQTVVFGGREIKF